MPADAVYQMRLEVEYAVPTMSLALRVHRGGMPGAPKGLGLVFENCHRGSSTNGVHMIKMRDFHRAGGFGLRAEDIRNAKLLTYSNSSGIAK